MNAGWPLSLAALCAAASCLAAWRSARVWLGLILTASLGLTVAAAQALGGAQPWAWRSAFTIGGESLHLRLDALGAIFLLLVAAVGAAGAAYARSYWPDAEHPHSAPRGRLWWSGLMASMAAVIVVANGLHFLLGWELFTLSAFFLITLERQQREVRAAGWLYLAASHTGTVSLFGFFALLAARTGSWDLGPMQSHPALGGAYWLALAGFGVKAGLFPLHVWLPSAHANAPSHVSAILSGVAIKMGVYGLMRFSGWVPVPAAAGWVMLGLGAVAALVGIAFALGQNDLKRLLAYSSVENVGVILVGLGAALLAVQHGGAPWGRLALAGALLHVVNHGLFKALLFLAAGAVLHATGTREMSRLGGLWRSMPWTTALFALGTFAVCALPPLNGFVSEWLIYLSLFDAAIVRGPVAWVAMPAAIMLAMTGALALATFVKAAAIVFLGAPRTAAAEHAHECGGGMRAPMLGLGAGCIALALLPALVWPALARASEAWHAAWPAAAAPVPLGTLSIAQGVFALALAAGVLLLWRRAHRLGLRRGLTWDCGYAAPTARMQYTSGSFGEIVAPWFAAVLRPQRTLERPVGYFPAGAACDERVPETVLELLLTPFARGVLRVSTLVRRLQHGRIQFYLVYLIAGVAALAAIVLGGGGP